MFKRAMLSNPSSVEHDCIWPYLTWLRTADLATCSKDGKAAVENKAVPQKTKQKTKNHQKTPAQNYSISTVAYNTWKNWNQGLRQIICTPLFIAALLRIAKSWKEPSLWTDGWINKRRSIHTMEYHSAVKKEMLTCATWILKTLC